MPPLPRDKLQPPLSCPQACSLGGLGISPCPGAEVVVSHHCPGGQDRGWGVSRGGQAGKPGERVSETLCPGKWSEGICKSGAGKRRGYPLSVPPTQNIQPQGREVVWWASITRQAPCPSPFIARSVDASIIAQRWELKFRIPHSSSPPIGSPSDLKGLFTPSIKRLGFSIFQRAGHATLVVTRGDQVKQNGGIPHNRVRTT